MNKKDVKIGFGEREIETSADEIKKAAELLSGEARLKEIAEEIIKIKEDRKRLNDAINELLEEAENFGIPKKAMRLAIEMWEDAAKAPAFNQGYFRACDALNIPIQLEMDFD